MSTKKLQILGALGNKVYSQNDEPVDALDGSLWVDLDEVACSSGGNVSYEQIADAVEDYFTEHPIEGKSGVYTLSEGETIDDAPADADVVIDPYVEPEIPEGGNSTDCVVELDTTLSKSGKAADAKAVGDAIREQTEAVDGLEAAVFETVETESVNKCNPNAFEQTVISGYDCKVSELIPCKVGDVLYFKWLRDDGKIEPTTVGIRLVNADGAIGFPGFSFYGTYTVPEHPNTPNLVGVQIIVRSSSAFYGNLENLMVTINEEHTGFVAWEPTGTKNVSIPRQNRSDIEKLSAELAADSLKDKKVLVIGDSISTDYYGEYEKWVTKLIKSGFFSEENVTNDSIHATGFVARFNNQPNDFITRIEAVQNKTDYDLVIVFGGINDYLHNIPMGESGGDKTTHFKPAVDYFFEYLTSNFIQARIAILSPLRTHQTAANTEGAHQTEYADYIKSVAKSYCLPILNLTEESGFYPWNRSFKNRWTFTGWSGGDGLTGDGVHPSEEWEEKFLAKMVKKFLQRLL